MKTPSFRCSFYRQRRSILIDHRIVFGGVRSSWTSLSAYEWPERTFYQVPVDDLLGWGKPYKFCYRIGKVIIYSELYSFPSCYERILHWSEDGFLIHFRDRPMIFRSQTYAEALSETFK